MSDHSQVEESDHPTPDDVYLHLEKILASKVMRRSESLSSFLQFVVEETLSGRGDRLKARVIAIRALGRDEQFSPQTDPIVRIQAGRLRTALRDYYVDAGAQDSVRIVIPRGTYQPQFRRVDQSRTEDQDWGQHPAGPSVAVIPIIEPDPLDDYFSTGLTQELIAAIAGYQELTVIAVPPLQQGQSVAQVAPALYRDLGARFALSGSLHRTATDLLLRLQLIDTSSATVVWTERITRDLTSAQLFEMEADIARQIASTVADNYGVIPRALTSEIHTRGTEDLKVYDAVLRFRYYTHVVSEESRQLAIGSLERAIQLDPNYALCWAMLSEAECDAVGLRIDCRPQVITRAKELARHAAALDPNCQHAHWALAYAHFHARERHGFLRAAQKTLELNPGNGFLVGTAAWALALVGEWERGLRLLGAVMDRNPYYPNWLHLAPYLDHYRRGEFEQALDHAEAFNTPDLAWDSLLRAAVLAELGRTDAAESALEELVSRFPEVAGDPRHYLRGYIFLDELVEEVAGGLRKAGLTEGVRIA